MTGCTDLHNNAQKYLAARDTLWEKVANHPDFQSTGLKIYPHDSIAANLPHFLELFDREGDFLNISGIERVMDIGGANGDIAIVFALSGYETTVIDLTLPWAGGPLVVSLLNKELEANLRVVDLDVDRYFDYQDLERHTVNGDAYNHRYSETQKFDLITCTGLIYHLKNPYAFLESVRRLTRYAVIGTWVMSYLPDNVTRLDTVPVVYLLGSGELNFDTTNYWIFTAASLQRLAERSGFRVLNMRRSFVREDRISNAVSSGYGERAFLLLEAV